MGPHLNHIQTIVVSHNTGFYFNGTELFLKMVKKGMVTQIQQWIHFFLKQIG
jgi:hypothetical protein